MAINISLAQFNRIASGEYNAGFIDFKTGADGKVLDELKKVNNHVHAVAKNTATISHERVLEVKEAFIAALERASVPPEKISEIRRELGIAASMDATSDKEQLGQMLQARFKPLTRQQVRAARQGLHGGKRRRSLCGGRSGGAPHDEHVEGAQGSGQAHGSNERRNRELEEGEF